eukprot:4699887-Prymnesium_polylepis.1
MSASPSRGSGLLFIHIYGQDTRDGAPHAPRACAFPSVSPRAARPVRCGGLAEKSGCGNRMGGGSVPPALMPVGAAVRGLR